MLRALTPEPRLDVPAARLPPGSYRWRVVALDDRGRARGAAIVDAKLNLG